MGFGDLSVWVDLDRMSSSMEALRLGVDRREGFDLTYLDHTTQKTERYPLVFRYFDEAMSGLNFDYFGMVSVSKTIHKGQPLFFLSQ